MWEDAKTLNALPLRGKVFLFGLLKQASVAV
jgi:hypothetical protein